MPTDSWMRANCNRRHTALAMLRGKDVRESRFRQTGLCRELEISRKTGYKIWNRCRDCGLTDPIPNLTRGCAVHLKWFSELLAPRRIEPPSRFFQARSIARESARPSRQ